MILQTRCTLHVHNALNTDKYAISKEFNHQGMLCGDHEIKCCHQVESHGAISFNGMF